MNESIDKTKKEIIEEVISKYNMNMVAMGVIVSGAVYLIGRNRGLTIGRAVGHTEGYSKAMSDFMTSILKETKKDSDV